MRVGYADESAKEWRLYSVSRFFIMMGKVVQMVVGVGRFETTSGTEVVLGTES